MVADGGPFCSANDSNVLDRENGEKEILVGPVIPVFVHLRGGEARLKAQWVYKSC